MKKNPILPVFVTVFIDLVGLGIVIPILAPYFFEPNNPLFPPGTDIAIKTMVLGVLIAIYPLAQFFGAPILGALSDRYGRKRLLMLSLFGTFLGYILSGIGILTHHLPLLFFSRFVDGFTGGNISIALSAMADLSDEMEKAKNFGLIGMAFGLGFILGPFIGGKLGDSSLVSWFNYATPYWFAAILSAFNIMLVFLKFPETLKVMSKAKISVLTGFRNIAKAFRMPNLRTMFIVVFLLTFGFNFFTQFFQVFLIQKFSFTEGQIGNLFGYMGLWIAVAQGGLTRPLSKRYRPEKVFNVSALLLALVLPLLLIPDKSYFLYFIMPLIAVSNGLTQPNRSAIVSNLAGKESQGEILGIQQSIQSLGMALPPLMAGVIFNINMNLPITVAAISIFLSWLIFFALFRKQNKHLFHEV